MNLNVLYIYSYLIFFFSTFTFGCVTATENTSQKGKIPEHERIKEVSLINLSTDNTAEAFRLSDMLRNVSFIPLESNEESLISYTSKILFLKDRFFVFDRAQANIKVFSENGDYLFSIDKQGNGPGEYISLDDVNVFPDSSALSIFSLDSQKLIFYDWEGNYQKEVGTAFYGLSFSWLSKKELALFSNYSWSTPSQNNKLYTADISGKVLNRYFPYPTDREIASSAVSGFIYQNNNYSLFSEPYLDSIYELRPSGIQAKYAFNFGQRQMPKELFEGGNNDKFREHALEYDFLLPNIAENKHALIFSYLKDKNDCWGIYSPSSGMLIRNTDLIEDLWQAVFDVPVGKMPDGRFLIAIQASSMIDMQNENDEKLNWNSPGNETFKNAFEKLGENDNLVLMVFDLDI